MVWPSPAQCFWHDLPQCVMSLSSGRSPGSMDQSEAVVTLVCRRWNNACFRTGCRWSMRICYVTTEDLIICVLRYLNRNLSPGDEYLACSDMTDHVFSVLHCELLAHFSCSKLQIPCSCGMCCTPSCHLSLLRCHALICQPTVNVL